MSHIVYLKFPSVTIFVRELVLMVISFKIKSHILQVKFQKINSERIALNRFELDTFFCSASITIRKGIP